MFDTLRSSSRRQILLAVADQNSRGKDEFTKESLVPDERDDDKCEEWDTQLHHVHLPKLADKGYLEWNPNTETVRRGPNFDEIAHLLKAMDNHADELPDDWP
ncbi:DUF7344 domain-containing protein [Halomicrococcus sp. NG-SE-24]|uniref:DUF7344 domain-containing protein n=1 Tax=Halomicrococcus sp. NG-SE-24 TaxID=3436928 RepID=UPI003D96E245